MVDCFFLITEFFVLTFQFKKEGYSLPQKMPPGGHPPPITFRCDTTEAIPIHVRSDGSKVTYMLHSQPLELAQLEEQLAIAAQHGKDRYQVKVTYEPQAQYGDVIAVLNACQKVKLERFGLVPLRDSDTR
ncbi:MAG TPA: biopolymer transporter ExbD [Planctomycetota bacterium]|nr:biopolymer transporter ExbD [Planctomycetota bacterium]